MGKSEKLKGSLGTELKKIRTQKRSSLDKIGAKLRINVKYLKSIENNEFDFLHRPYVLAFVKAYANELGLDADEVKEKFDQQLRAKFETPSIDKLENIQKPAITNQISESVTIAIPVQSREFGDFINQNKKTIVFVSVITLFIIIIFLLQKYYFGSQDTVQITPQETLMSEAAPRSALIDTAERRRPAIDTPLELRLVTNENLWLRMIVDNGISREFTFDQNETRSWTAQDRFEMRIGKSVGFDLYFNDSLLRNLGDENTMIGNLVLTKDGISDLRLELQPPDTTIQR